MNFTANSSKLLGEIFKKLDVIKKVIVTFVIGEMREIKISIGFFWVRGKKNVCKVLLLLFLGALKPGH